MAEVLAWAVLISALAHIGRRYGHLVTTPVMIVAWVLSAMVFVVGWRAGLVVLAVVFGFVSWLGTLVQPHSWILVVGSIAAAAVCVWSAASGSVPGWVIAFLRRDLTRNS